MRRNTKADRRLLTVLDRPETPLHTNGSENDIRCQVTKRKISGGTRSNRGRDCRFLGLANTCGKLGITFWDYLGARLDIPNQNAVPPLQDIVRVRCAAAPIPGLLLLLHSVRHPFTSNCSSRVK